MANQKITDLNKLHQLDSSDLFIVVDRDSKSNSTSPTGETKGISASSLATELTRIANNEVGIDFKNLRDVPDSYLDNLGGFIRIKADGSGVEFTDSPGASEQSFPGTSLETHINGIQQEYNVGNLLIATQSQKFQKASCLDPATAEVIGIIKKIKYKQPSGNSLVSNVIDKINIVFNGLVSWTWDDEQMGGPLTIEKQRLDPTNPNFTKIYENQLLIPGKTYFLGKHGTLVDFEPTEETNLSGAVSKPVLVATSSTSGVMVNYRGLVCNSDEQANKFVIYEPAACNSIKTGDVLRIKRKKIRTEVDNMTHNSAYSDTEEDETVLPPFLEREGGTTNYALCNSASQLKDLGANSPAEDDNYGCDMLGVVINSTSDFFEIQTSGLVEFQLPEYEVNSETDSTATTLPINRLFQQGYTYYIESFPINDDQEASTNKPTELRNSIYDYSSEELGDALRKEKNGQPSNPMLATKLRPALSGTSPFRNTTNVDPFKRDSVTGKVISYSKPAFYALSPTKILILDQTAYPNPKDSCNAIDPTSGSPCASYDVRDVKNFSINRNLTFSSQTQLESFSNDFLKAAWFSANINDKAFITYIFEYVINNETTTQFETHEFVKLDSATNSNWSYMRRVS
jgi:hypothetical protein